jgi:hypothetical protein
MLILSCLCFSIGTSVINKGLKQLNSLYDSNAKEITGEYELMMFSYSTPEGKGPSTRYIFIHTYIKFIVKVLFTIIIHIYKVYTEINDNADLNVYIDECI